MMTTLLAAALLPSNLVACVNVKGTSLDGHSRIQHHADGRLRRIMAAKPGEVTVRNKFGISDSEALTTEAQAVDMILRGDAKSAIPILLEMEKQEPGDYSTAANIGTAYELIGDNANALKWIEEGMMRNSESHYGTEWLHALILEAKIKSAGGPLHSRLLDIPDRVTGKTAIMVRGQSCSMAEVKEALFHQLEERVFFVKPKDPYVADLLFSFAVVEANLGTVESALGLLDLGESIWVFR